MGDQDLLSDDDFFEKSKPEPKEEKSKKDDVYSEEEDFFKKKEVDQSSMELEDIESSLEERPDTEPPKKEESQDFFENIQENIEVEESDEMPPPQDPNVAPPPPATKEEDIKYKKVYFDIDDKQEKISYKPFVIGFLVVIILVVGGYFIYQWLFSDKGATPEQPITQTQSTEESTDPAQSQDEIRKANYLSNLAGRTNLEMSSVSNVVGAAIKSTRLSSILLYDSDFMFEVFSKNREELARLNMELKNTFKDKQFKIISSSERPGENGGILGVYSAKFDGAGSGGQEVNKILGSGNEADQWLRGILNQNKLKVKSVKSRSSSTTDMFTVYEIEATANGSINACVNAMNSIASAGSNVKLHKLICNAVDQKSFTSENYQLKLVVKIYV